MKTATNRWNVKDPIYGACTILPSSIRYGKTRNQKHPYGWEVSFWVTLVKESGEKVRTVYSAIGTSRQAAMANAIPR